MEDRKTGWKTEGRRGDGDAPGNGPAFIRGCLCVRNLGQNESLERIDRTVDWEGFRRLVQGVYGATKAGPAILPVMMVKVLLLEQWYVLSDPQMEEALRDRISFRRFVGVDLQDHTPDHFTLSRMESVTIPLVIGTTLTVVGVALVVLGAAG